MLAIPELAMPKSQKVITMYNGKREVWTKYEEVKYYFLEMMISNECKLRDRAECVNILFLYGLDECQMINHSIL